MPEKFICNLTKEELEQLYLEENRTLVDMCEIIGVKSPITMSKILREKGVTTNKNAIRSNATKKGMTDEEFKDYLIFEYKDNSIRQIAHKLNVTQVAIRKYFKKYNIPFKEKKDTYLRGAKAPNWNGGRHMHNGYIEIYAPKHPHKNKRNCIYEHQKVMEDYLGRYLEKGEVVHHKDLCKTNNNIENLQLLTMSEHSKLHAKLRKERNDDQDMLRVALYIRVL